MLHPLHPVGPGFFSFVIKAYHDIALHGVGSYLALNGTSIELLVVDLDMAPLVFLGLSVVRNGSFDMAMKGFLARLSGARGRFLFQRSVPLNPPLA